jgi:hypothetical protein
MTSAESGGAATWFVIRARSCCRRLPTVLPALAFCPISLATVFHQRVTHINRPSAPPECLNGSKVTLAPLIAAHISPADEVSFPLPNSSAATSEILVTKNSLAGSGRDLYHAPIGYVTRDTAMKRSGC